MHDRKGTVGWLSSRIFVFSLLWGFLSLLKGCEGHNFVESS